jgi:UDP-N-acetylbacillosamine N-acetyltransferase
MNLLIVGAGGHGQVVREVAEAIGTYEKISFADDNNEIAIGKMEDLQKLHGEYEAAFVGIGNNHLRRELLEKLQSYGYSIPVLIHPTAYVSRSAQIGKGTVVEPKAIVNTASRVWDRCIISVGAIVDHDVILEECVHVNAGAICKAGSTVTAEIKLEAGQVVKGY